jgi:hypothetical protein
MAATPQPVALPDGLWWSGRMEGAETEALRPHEPQNSDAVQGYVEARNIRKHQSTESTR